MIAARWYSWEMRRGIAGAQIHRPSGNRWFGRSPRARRVLFVVATGLLAAAGMVGPLGGSAIAAVPAWSQVSSPNPAHQSGTLSAVSCPGANNCVAVGSYAAPNGQAAPLIARLNGQTWTAQAAPVPADTSTGSLSGVSCPSATFCVAVGKVSTPSFVQHAIIDTWNGQTWKVSQPLPFRLNPALSGVSCTSTTVCVAVGSFQSGAKANRYPISLTWNGKTWSGHAIPAPYIPYPYKATTTGAVHCINSTRCVMVATQQSALGPVPRTPTWQTPYASEWNGSSWTSKPLPGGFTQNGQDSARLTAVACPTATMCLTGGSNVGPAGLLTYSGGTWAATPSTGSGNWSSISCSTATSCRAVGSGVIGSWNGTQWSTEPRTGTELGGVSCLPNETCVAVGGRGGRPVALASTGGAWTPTTISVPNGRGNDRLMDISCPTTNSCTAVGFSIQPDNTALALIERWNGSVWTIQASAGGPMSLSHVSCPTADQCVALVDQVDTANGKVVVLKSGTWTAQPLPIANPRAVDCPAVNNCLAIGIAADGSPSAARWNGTTWSLTAAPALPGSYVSILGLDCLSPTSCLAVGGSESTSQTSNYPYASRWNGTTWTNQTLPDSPATLFDVSCTATNRCVAIAPSLVLAWNGTAWSPQGTADQQLGGSAVSCSANNRCAGISNFSELTDVWDGTSWSVIQSATLADDQSPELNAVACIPAGPCFAVGDTYTGLSPTRATLIERLS
jgi:hypothetical protein